MASKVRVILVATDLEERSRGAIELAGTLAASLGGRVVALHVVELPLALKRWSAESARADVAMYRRLLANQAAGAQAALEQEVEKVLGDGARAIARIGWIAETVKDVADEVKADLIVVARGRGGRLGRNSERIVRLEGRAVLVAPVKAPSKPWAWALPSRPRLPSSHSRRRSAKS